MKTLLALALAAGVVMMAPSVARADDGSVSTRAADVDLKTNGGSERYFRQLELGGGAGG